MGFSLSRINSIARVGFFLMLGLSCKKSPSSTTGSAFSLDQSNVAIKSRLESCLAQGSNYVFQNEICYDPAVIKKQKADCSRDNTQTWDDASMACVNKMALSRENCLNQGTGYFWGNDECYAPTEEKPTPCDANLQWDGLTCVEATKIRNYYRFCISHALSIEAKNTVQAIEKAVGQSTCQTSFTLLSTTKKLDLSNQNLVNIVPLVGLTSLIELNLSHNQISDPSSLTYLTALQSLDVSNNQLQSTNFIRILTQLQTLHIQNNPAKDYQYLFGLSALTSIDISPQDFPKSRCIPGIASPAFQALCAVSP